MSKGRAEQFSFDLSDESIGRRNRSGSDASDGSFEKCGCTYTSFLRLSFKQSVHEMRKMMLRLQVAPFFKSYLLGMEGQLH